MAFIIGVLAFCGLIALSSIWSGYVLSILWGWFMVPIFGLPILSLPAAIGVALVVAFLTHQHTYKQKHETGEQLASGLFYAAISPLVTLIIGWVVMSFL